MRLRESVEWVIQDMSFKAPEQMGPDLVENWLRVLQSGIDEEVDARELTQREPAVNAAEPLYGKSWAIPAGSRVPERPPKGQHTGFPICDRCGEAVMGSGPCRANL